jgi:protein SCO1/2
MTSRGLRLAFAILAFGQAAAAGQLPSESLYVEPLRFRDDAGAPVELARFRGHPVALSMFYTDCSTLCPITLQKLREIDGAFAHRSMDLQIVLVSYDSVHETPRRLAHFRQREKLSSERWHLLSGDESSVERLARRIGLGSFQDLGEHIVHSFRIVTLDEDGVQRKALDARHDRVFSLFDGMAASSP